MGRDIDEHPWADPAATEPKVGEETEMANSGDEVEELKRLIRAFAVELDTTTMPYVNDGLQGTVMLTEMSDADRAAGKRGLAVGSTALNAGRPAELRWEATDVKRSGQYLASAEKIIEAFRLERSYDLVNIRNLWKVALCGGDASGAVALIRKAVSTYETYEIARRYEQLPHPPQEDLVDVLGALQTEQSCKSRLRDFSGNPDYLLPRPYQAIKAELQGDSKKRPVLEPQPVSQKSSGGCYVATAVYGSYEAPEVRVLRKFRDERLRQSVVGRSFIAVYYAVSPTLARHLPKSRTLSSWIRHLLDSIVDRLQSSSD